MSQIRRADPDRELHDLRARKPAAVTRWFEAHADPLYAFVFYRVARDADLAADVVQETFATALDRIAGFDPARGEMFSWLTGLARNALRTTLRRLGRRETAEFWERVDARTLDAIRCIESAPLPDEIVERAETAELVRAALTGLPLRYQEALTGHYCEKLSLEQIAARSGSTVGAVKSLLFRARAALKAALEAIADVVEAPAAGGPAP